MARLASILYLEKLNQGSKRENEGNKSTHGAEPDKGGEGERERRQRLKALLLHITDDEGEELHGPKGVAFSTDAKRLLQTFFLEAAGILTEQAEGLALEAWQSRHPERTRSHRDHHQQQPRPAAADSSADVGHNASSDHPVDTASDDNEEQTSGLSSASSSSSVAVMSSTSPLSTSPPDDSSPPICSSLSSCSSFASCDTLPPPSSLSLSSSFVPVSSTPTTASAHSQSHAMHSSAPIDTRRTRAAPAAIGLDQPSVSWHHVVKAVELLLQLPLDGGGSGEASDEGPGRASTHGADIDGDISAAADATLSAAHRRREKARSLSALGRNNMEDPLLRHYSFFRLIDQNVPVFLRLLEGEQQRWDFVSKQHGVVIHRRTIAPAPRGRNIHCFRGVGVIRAPPSVVKEYLFEQKEWALWDCYAKDCREVERLDSCTKIMQFRYETERCFVQHRRDFCALLHLVRRPRGAILLFGQSVEHPMCPPLEGWTRGVALHSGALIEPKKDGEGNLVSKVTIITQIDLVGLPAAIVNMVQVQRPLLVAQIQQRLDDAANQS